MTDRLLTATEVARLYGVNVKTVSNWARTGALPAIKPGGHWRFRAADVKARLNEGHADG